ALASRTVVTPGSLLRWLEPAYLERVVFDGDGRAREVGPRRRLVRGRHRRAIAARDLECYHPLCEVPGDQCEIDHIEPYAHGGDTTIDNGRLACGFHNRARNHRPDPAPRGDLGEDLGEETGDDIDEHE